MIVAPSTAALEQLGAGVGLIAESTTQMAASVMASLPVLLTVAVMVKPVGPSAVTVPAEIEAGIGTTPGWVTKKG